MTGRNMVNGNDRLAHNGEHTEGTFVVKSGLAQMCKGGLIMDVVNVEQAKIAEEAGACAVMALERVPADIRKDGGVARMSDPKMIKEIMEAVTIPVFAKVRIGHFVEAQILEAIGVDMIDESEGIYVDSFNTKVNFIPKVKLKYHRMNFQVWINPNSKL